MLTAKRALTTLLTVASLATAVTAADPVSSAIARSRAINPLASRSRVQSYRVVAPSYGYSPGYWGWRRGYVLNDRVRAYNDRVRAFNDRVRAVGEVQLLQSHARVNHSVAADQELDNNKKRLENYWQARDLRRDKVHGKGKNAQERLAQRKRILSSQRPERMTKAWPAALASGNMAELSKQISDRLQNGQFDNAIQLVRQLKSQLRSEVSQHPTAEYIAAKSFLKSLEYDLTMELRGATTTAGLAASR